MEQAQEFEKDSFGAEQLKEVAIFLGPEAIVMLLTAIVFDVGEVLVELIPYAGQILSIIMDIIAVIFFGAWMWFRSGQMAVPQKTGERIAKAKTQVTKWSKRLKWLRPLAFVLEMIPVVGALPLWTLVVYFELKYNTK